MPTGRRSDGVVVTCAHDFEHRPFGDRCAPVDCARGNAELRDKASGIRSPRRGSRRFRRRPDLFVVLEVRNDNSYDVQIRNVHANVAFGRGYGLGPIDYSPNQWLPAKQATLVPVPVAIPWGLVPVLIAETAGSFAIPYHVKGSADVTATQWGKFERNDYPVDENGAVPRQMVVDAARNAIPLPIL